MISDNGKGIPQEQHKIIFEEFQQLSRNPSAGMGLGLAIVKQLCNLLQLSLGLQSSSGQGATFWLDIPLVKPNQTSTLNPHAVESNSQKNLAKRPKAIPARHLIVLDDQPEIAKDTANRLKSWGFTVTSCISVAEARKAFEIQKPDILISDYHLADDTNGIEALQAFRQEFNTSLPTLLITADTTIQLPDNIPNLIMAHKPLAPARLRLMINHLLQ
jgi:CheY-like chemotaxis protein